MLYGKMEQEIEIYKLLKQEIHHRDQLVWKTRNWSILVAGGTIAICLDAFASEPKTFATISNPYLISEIVITGGSIINLFFWYISSAIVRGIIQKGAYLYCLEKKLGINNGWEAWIFKCQTKIGIDLPSLFEDVQFYISAGLLLLLAILNAYYESELSLIYACALFLLIGSFYKAMENSYRNKALKDAKSYFDIT
ncbi:MAG: hypothetical protein JMN27_11910 [gamma proteobacterium endosymbiont of Lamellibrachia anaximandri]|nr:hypothetical protein [gamma proteobacterium endosymbiont of Lamellibrachia anaximandri]MBL3534526.1 hypothetical protein [gamma proteobacterium endosymbiont of Lamellibrachia anaximandri]